MALSNTMNGAGYTGKEERTCDMASHLYRWPDALPSWTTSFPFFCCFPFFLFFLFLFFASQTLTAFDVANLRFAYSWIRARIVG